MNTFQWIALPALALLCALTLLLIWRRRIGWLAGAAWAAIWVAGTLAVARPELARDAARAVGIGRGVDLVMYCAILALFAVNFRLGLQLRRVESDLTTVVREIALLRAGRESGA